MRDTSSDTSRDRPKLWTGAILLVIGLSLVLIVSQWFAMFDACVANPTCHATGSADVDTGFLAVEVMGIIVSVVGTVCLSTCGRGRPDPPDRAELSDWNP